MATYPKTQFSTNDALTRKKWARDLFSILLKAIEFNDLVGTSDTSIVQMRKELGKGEGDVIKFGIRLPLTQEGIVGYDTVEGNEEKLIFRDFSTTVEELNFAVDTGGKMEEQRIPYNLLEIGKTALQERWADRLSDIMCGDTTFLINGKTFAQTPTAPDTYHHFKVNDVAEASMTAADELDLSFLDRMKQAAEAPDTATWGSDHYRVRPLMIGGKKYYRVILHNYVFDRLRTNMNVGQWGDLQRAAQKLAVPNVEFEYNGMLVSKSERIRSLVSNVYRNVLLGSQALVLAWGGAGESKSTTMSFVPYTKDAERYVMIRGGGILGIKKTVFNSKDYGVITGASYATKLG
jgi:N4-gp56 family major capsid protein